MDCDFSGNIIERKSGYEKELLDNFDSSHEDLLEHIRKTGELPDKKKLQTAVEKFTDSFSPSKN